MEVEQVVVRALVLMQPVGLSKAVEREKA